MTLYTQLCSSDLLWSAWQKVKSKATTGGIDNVTISDFNKNAANNIATILKSLTNNTYAPSPYLEVHIPKGNGKTRQLGLLSVVDKIVQTALGLIIEKEIEKQFLPVSYAYRQGFGNTKAARDVWQTIKTMQPKWYIKADIKSFFDTVDHTRLELLLVKWLPDNTVNSLIMLLMKMGSVTRQFKWTDKLNGIPQGAILSPLLSNMYLHELDVYIKKFDVKYFRYADDFIVFADNRDEAFRVLNAVKQFIDVHLKLSLNEKTVIGELQNGVQFLGITYFLNRYGLGEQKKTAILDKIKQAIHLDRNLGGRKLKESIDSILRYYALLLEDIELAFIDVYLEQELIKYAEQLLKKVNSKSKLLSTLDKVAVFVTQKYQAEKKLILKRIVNPTINKSPEQPATEIIINRDAIIRKKKLEYAKLESQSLELVINADGVFIGKSQKGITVKSKGINILSAPTARVQHIAILSNGVSLSGYLVKHCAQNEIPIDFYNEQGKPYARLYNNDTSNTALWIKQLEATTTKKIGYLALVFVSSKIVNQINLIKYYNKYYKRSNTAFVDLYNNNIVKMEACLIEAKNYIFTDIATYRLQLMSAEGRCAALYWELVALMVGNEGGFDGREQQGAGDIVNAMLNYGYGILYGKIWDAVLKSNLNPSIGFLHAPADGKPTLTFDLIEEFRQQVVDKCVIALITKGEKMEISNNKLTPDTRKRLAEKVLLRLNTEELFRGERRRLTDIIKLQAFALRNYIEGKTKTYNPYTLKW